MVKKFATLMSAVDNGGSCACVEVEDMWQISVTSSPPICCKLTTALKKLALENINGITPRVGGNVEK